MVWQKAINMEYIGDDMSPLWDQTNGSSSYQEPYGGPILNGTNCLSDSLELFNSKSLRPQDFEEQLTLMTPFSLDSMPKIKLMSSYLYYYPSPRSEPYTTSLPPWNSSTLNEVSSLHPSTMSNSCTCHSLSFLIIWWSLPQHQVLCGRTPSHLSAA